MIFLYFASLWLADVQSSQAPSVASEEAIVVVGQRMRRLKLHTKTDKKTGVMRCVFKRQTGDEAFDAMMCDAVRKCAPTVRVSAQMEVCVRPNIEAFAQELAARSALRRQLADPR